MMPTRSILWLVAWVTLPASAAWCAAAAVTHGAPYAMHLESGALAYCDRLGGHKVDLASGRTSALTRPCATKDDPNTSCSGLGVTVDVRGSTTEPYDVVDVGAESIRLAGKVHDCAADGTTVAVLTPSSCVIIDGVSGASRTISHAGGDRVAIGPGWVVWSRGQMLHAVRR